MRGTLIVFGFSILLMAGCSDKKSSQEASDPVAVRMKQDLVVASDGLGSTLIAAVAEQLDREEPKLKIQVPAKTPEQSVEAFKSRSIDAFASPVPLSESQLSRLENDKREFIQIPIALDAGVFVLNKENTWAKDIKLEEARQIWIGQTKTGGKWSEIRKEWPQRELIRFLPPGMGGVHEMARMTLAAGSDQNLASSEAVARFKVGTPLQGVFTVKDSIGYFSYSTAKTFQEKLSIASVDGVMPTDETIANGSYPLASPIYLFLDPQELKERPALSRFVNALLDSPDSSVRSSGLVPLPEHARALAREHFEKRLLGSHHTTFLKALRS